MLGAIVGDIAGSRYEFNNTSDYNFDMFGAGSSITDDTICTIAIADAINDCNEDPQYRQKLVEWCKAFPNPQGGYGVSFNRWIHSDSHEPYNSFGNGAAMRVSPVAWAYDDLNRVLEEAKKTAMVSHNHPEGIKGAQAIAHAIFHLRTTRDLKGLENIAVKYYPNLWTDYFIQGVFNETCQGTVPVAFRIILASHSFEDAIRRAVIWGGDSDTLGAIVGSMAEAIYGFPHQFSNSLACGGYLTDEMKDVITIFLVDVFSSKHRK